MLHVVITFLFVIPFFVATTSSRVTDGTSQKEESSGELKSTA